MAVIHRATLTPTKLELLAGWVPTRPWGAGATGLRQLGAYRLDDPDGEVGGEAFLLGTDDGTVLHVPVTYRGAPLAGGEEHLVGTTDHSVLGPRWVYDGCADPVWVAAAATACLTGGTGAEELVEVDGRWEPRETTATVRGTGGSPDGLGASGPVAIADGPVDDGQVTTVAASGVELVVVRRVGTGVSALTVLEGTWSGGMGVLAGVRGRAPQD